MTKYFNNNVKMIDITYTYFPVAENANIPQQQIYLLCFQKTTTTTTLGYTCFASI